MLRKLCAFFLAFLLLGSGAAVLAEQEPIPIEFRKAGGGQWIYCNNPEFIGEEDLSTIENPEATYMMKNESLGPDHYSVFFCFYNWTSFDVEADIEFFAEQNAVITIDSVGFYLPHGYEPFDCLGTWSDYMGINIRKLNGYEQFVPYQGDTGLPKTISLSGGKSDWISSYIYNYDVVKPHTCFHMLVDFTIESGEADVNFAALKNYGLVGDRSYHNPNAAPGKYYNDTSVKGIETESLPMVEADLNVSISEGTPNGERLPVKVTNQYYNDGIVVPYWMTNINPNSDQYMFSKSVAAGSDMLTLTYKDDSKLAYYGPDVPPSERNNVWTMDIYHHNTLGYEEEMPWEAATHVPNAFSSYTLSAADVPDTRWEFNLGNFGVIYRYHLTITNNDSVPRVLNYTLDTTQASNIVIARDEAGNILNPYTLTKANPFALSKNVTSGKQEDPMFSAEVAPGQTKKYLLDVILPTNCYGGMLHALKVDTYKYLTPQDGTPFPAFTQVSEYKDVFFNGEQFMKWQDGELYQYTKEGYWQHIVLPGDAKKIFEGRSKEFRIVKISNGYAARFAGWDGFGWNITNKETENKVYYFDSNFHHTNTVTFPDYIYDMAYADGTLYVASDQYYQARPGSGFVPMGAGTEFPVVTDGRTILRKNGELYVRDRYGRDAKISFENQTPHELMSAGGLFYYRKSWKAYFTDTSTKNILSVSDDGINWTDIYLPDKFYELMGVCDVDGKIQVDCKYEVFTFDKNLPKDAITVNLNGELLSFDVPARTVADRTMIPLRFLFEKLDARVDWEEETQTITITGGGNSIIMQIGNYTALVNGQEYQLDAAPYTEYDKTLIPLRFLAENLGYSVAWDAGTSTASIAPPAATPAPQPTATPDPAAIAPAATPTAAPGEAE